MVILIVNLADAANPEALLPFVLPMESVPVCPTFRAARVINAVPVTGNIPNA